MEDDIRQDVLEKILDAEKRDLMKLDLNNNQITTIPNAICNLINLQYLYLSSNQITTIPDAICNLTCLQTLSLANNQITTIPDAIGNLTNLNTLYLSYNQITTIPDAIGNLTNLQELYLSNNPVYAQHRGKSVQQIIQYYKNAAHREYCLIYLSLAMECSYPAIMAVRNYWISPE